jgi:4-hydroxy-2-oxoheptanedioate aldolase
MPNPLKQMWSRSETVISGWLSIPSGYAAEIMAKAGYDALTVDMQHGVQDYQSLVACLQSIPRDGPVPMVRVPWNEPGIIGKVLDAGAMGVICPMVNTPQEARAFVSAVRYPPLGARSHGPIRVGTYGEAGTYYLTANTDVICMPMIETEEAVGNIDAILDVPGIDAVYIGPGDLGMSIGLPPKIDREEPEILRFYETVLAACQKRGIHAGLHNSAAPYAVRMMQMGFRFVVLSSDSGILLRAAKNDVQMVQNARSKFQAGGKSSDTR